MTNGRGCRCKFYFEPTTWFVGISWYSWYNTSYTALVICIGPLTWNIDWGLEDAS
jgi:hypothetical protein